MHFQHHQVQYSLPDDWWNEAGISLDQLVGRSYPSGPSRWPNIPVFELAIDEIQPLERASTHGVFNDNAEFGTAHERVTRILRGFHEKAQIPPIEVARLATDQPQRYKLIDGAHRLYCSIAVGFTHVPAVEVDDIFGAYP